MSDEPRDGFARTVVRQALREMVDVAPEPLSFDHVKTRTAGRRRLSPRSVAVLVVLLASVAVVGLTSFVATESTPHPPAGDELSGPDQIGSRYVVPGSVPQGWKLAVSTSVTHIGFHRTLPGSESLFVRTSDEGDDELFVGVVAYPVPELDEVLDRLSGLGTLTEVSIRERPAFLITAAEESELGWSTAVVVVESPTLMSEVTGSGVSGDEILSIAEDLTFVTHELYRHWVMRETATDLVVWGRPSDLSAFIDQTTSIPEVADVILVETQDRASVRQHRRPTARILEPDGVGPAAQTPEPITRPWGPIRPPCDCRLFVAIEAGSDLIGAMTSIDRAVEDAHTIFPTDPQAVTDAYRDRVLAGASVVLRDPTIYQADASPEPEFDPSDLGTEMPLKPVSTPDPQFPSKVLQTLVHPLRTSPSGPAVHIGTVDGARMMLVFDDPEGVEYTFDANSDVVMTRSFAAPSYRYAMSSPWPRRGPEPQLAPVVTLWVPFETSVVVLEFPDGARYWQRPVAGRSLFPVTADPDAVAFALDRAGNEIGRWEPGPRVP